MMWYMLDGMQLVYTRLNVCRGIFFGISRYARDYMLNVRDE